MQDSSRIEVQSGNAEIALHQIFAQLLVHLQDLQGNGSLRGRRERNGNLAAFEAEERCRLRTAAYKRCLPSWRLKACSEAASTSVMSKAVWKT
jgi:hypothetical protein